MFNSEAISDVFATLSRFGRNISLLCRFQILNSVALNQGEFMTSIQRILGSLALTILMLLTFQNCGQPGSLALKSDGVSSSKLSDSAGPGLVVGPMTPTTPSTPSTQGPVSTPPVASQDTPAGTKKDPQPTTLQCDSMGVSAVSLKIKEVKAPSASGASSHLFEIVTNDSTQGANHSIKVRALHSARKLDKVDLILEATGSLMMTGNRSAMLKVSAPANGQKLRLALDHQNYSVTEGQIYSLNFKVDSSQQVVKNSCAVKKCDSDDDEDESDDDINEVPSTHPMAKMSATNGVHSEQTADDDDDDDEQESAGKTCVPKADECRLFLNLSNGSLSAAQ